MSLKETTSNDEKEIKYASDEAVMKALERCNKKHKVTLQNLAE